MTLNDTWGFKRNDRNWKTARTVIRNLVDAASRGGNLLVNVGPDAEGEFPTEAANRLEEVGRWTKANADSVFGAGPSPLRPVPWGRVTARPGALYLHVYDWPSRILEVPELRNAIAEAYLLSDAARSRLPVARSDNDVLVRLPDKAPDANDAVIVLKIVGAPDVVAPPGSNRPKVN